MSVSSATRKSSLQEWTDSAAPSMTRANGAHLAQHSAEPASRSRPPQVLPFDRAHRDVARLARAFIDGNFREPVPMRDLCHATGVGVRTVQRCFKQRFGRSVTSYLKAARLDAARRDLIATHPSRDSVTTIALRNGCSHLGRFSSEYRERFGQLPSETLRSEPSTLEKPASSASRTHRSASLASVPGRFQPQCGSSSGSLHNERHQ